MGDVDWDAILDRYDGLEARAIAAQTGLAVQRVRDELRARAPTRHRRASEMTPEEVGRFRKLYEAGVSWKQMQATLNHGRAMLRKHVGPDWAVRDDKPDESDGRVIVPVVTSSLEEWLKVNKPRRYTLDDVKAYNESKGKWVRR